MKNTLKVTSLASVILFAASASSLAGAADGTINFTGKIIDSGCEATVNGGTNTGTVPLGNVYKSAFKGVGTTAGGTASATGFTIEMNDCPSTVTSVTFKFDGTSAGGDPKAIALTDAPGVATGVGVQLTDKNSNIITLGAESAAYAIANTGAGSVNTLDFFAKYVQTLPTVTTGPANATATFTVNY